jgi:ABC-2 type transport system permease protein
MNNISKRILAVSKKEIRQLKRDIRMLFVLFVFPILLLVVFGYAINFDVRHIKIAVYDQDKSDVSRDFVSKLLSSDYFDLTGYLNSDYSVKEFLNSGEAQAVIIIPADFSKSIMRGGQEKIQILVDGVNGNTASVIMNYLNIAVLSYSQEIMDKASVLTGAKLFPVISLEPVFWYNPSLNSTFFLLPGLIAMILIITAVVSISLSIVREKEKGTMEQIDVSPVSSVELLIGKILPYTIIALLIAALVIFSGYVLFGVTVKGNYLLLLVTTLLFLFASLNLGIFVSSIADTQQVAFQIATLISLLPSVILSGFIFPIESMPVIIQWLTNITPAKFYVIILRGIMLKGVGIEAFWDQMVYLLIFAAFFLLLAALRNRKRKAV